MYCIANVCFAVGYTFELTLYCCYYVSLIFLLHILYSHEKKSTQWEHPTTNQRYKTDRGTPRAHNSTCSKHCATYTCMCVCLVFVCLFVCLCHHKLYNVVCLPLAPTSTTKLKSYHMHTTAHEVNTATNICLLFAYLLFVCLLVFVCAITSCVVMVLCLPLDLSYGWQMCKDSDGIIYFME